MTMIAACDDATPPAEGAAFSACTAVVWQEQPSAIPELTLDGAAQVAGAVLMLWTLAYVGRMFIRVIRRYGGA
ncbi:MAG: hypothetical protein AB7P31_06250 [Steroidobacteraceae bacterium]